MKFIACADLHLRQDKPRCRQDDDWLGFQESRLNSVADYANEYDCPVFIAGDLFNKPVVPEEIVNMFIDFCKKVNNGVYAIAGNHDLLYHSMKYLNKSSIGILFNMASISDKLHVFDSKYISYANFGENIQGEGKELLVIHQLTFPDKNKIPPNTEALSAEELLDIYPDYTYILTGDCHIPFVYSKDNRYVINPGHLDIQKNNELDTPRIYFVDTEKQSIKAIELPETYDLVTDEYIRNEEEREEKIQAFVEKLRVHDDFSLSFEDNIEQEIELNKKQLDSKVIEIIQYLMNLKEKEQ